MKKLISTIFVAFLLISPVIAQLDPSFGVNGVATTSIAPNDRLQNTFVLPDGKILLLQYEYISPSMNNFHLVRLNSNGSLDTSYGSNGVSNVTVPFITTVDLQVTDSQLQADGKILLAGRDNLDGFITRINQDGTLDASFAVNGFHRQNFFGATDTLYKILLLPDGKIMGFGSTGSVPQSNDANVFFIRYLSNGLLDTTFGTANQGYLITNLPSDRNRIIAARQSSGKFLFNTESSLVRINPDGSSDPTFQTISSFYYLPFAITNNDKIIVVDNERITGPLERDDYQLNIVRYNSDGSPDSAFGTNGSTKVDMTSLDYEGGAHVIKNADGKIIIASFNWLPINRTRFKSKYFGMVKLSEEGILEGKMLVTSGNPLKVNLLQNGQFLVSGGVDRSANNRDLVVAKLTDIPLTTVRLQGIPFDFDNANLTFPSSGKVSYPIFRPSGSRWIVSSTIPYVYGGVAFGTTNDVLVPSDYRGDFQSEMGVFRPSNGFWYIADANLFFPSQTFWSYQWGQNGDIPVPADFNGDSKSDIAVFRPSNGVWYILNTNDNSYRFFPWGMMGDKPVAGDYDGDGIYDIAIWRPSNGLWCIFYSSNNQMAFIPFGLPDDIPVQEDYDGDGKFDIAVWRPSDGHWYRLNSSDWSFTAIHFGLQGDNPIPADYDGDGITDIAVKRNSDNNWYILNSSNNSLKIWIWGTNTDIPLPIRY